MQIRPSTTFMFSHLNDMFVNSNKHPYLRKFIFLQHPSRCISEISHKLGFDGTLCTMSSNKCKKIHVNNTKVCHTTFAHKRTLLIGTFAQVLTPSLSCSHFKQQQTPSDVPPSISNRQALHSARVRCSDLHLHVHIFVNNVIYV